MYEVVKRLYGVSRVEEQNAAYEELLTHVGKERYALSVACELLGEVERVCGEYELTSHSVKDRCLLGIVRCIERHDHGRIPVDEKLQYYQKLSDYLRGRSMEWVDLKVMEERGWPVLRARIRDELESICRDESNLPVLSGNGTADGVAPVVAALQRKSMEAIRNDEVVGK